MRCLNTYFDKKNNREFNCGHCMPCRINRTTQWTLRILFELSEWDKASFCTFTYDDEHLPLDCSLHYEDLQKFWKLLRRHYPNRKFKYYCCGEYGDKTFRPHYHAIIFGLDSYSKEDRQSVNDLWKYSSNDYFYIGKDHKGILPVCREDIRYVAGYVQKKLYGQKAKEVYGSRVAPFSRCSQGLGLETAKRNIEQFKFLGYTTLHGKRLAIPRYFRDKLNLNQQELITTNLTKEDIDKQGDYLTNKFLEEKGLDMSYFFGKDGKPNELAFRRLENWIQNYLFSIGDCINNQFIQKQTLYRGKI
ncbi:replication initiator protein [Microvirus sp.]|nr:replication initiator protein [Microvirus sp.]